MNQELLFNPEGTLRASGGHTLGPEKAALTLVEYGDYECSFCASANETVKQIRARLGDKLSYTFLHFPLTARHPHAQLAAEAAEAAGRQGKFWEMHDLLFSNPDALDRSSLIRYAESLGLDLRDFISAIELHPDLARVRMQLIRGIRNGVEGTPTFFMNGNLLGGSEELLEFLHALEAQAQGQAA